MVSLLMKSEKSTVGVHGSFWLKMLELLGSSSFLRVTAKWYLEGHWLGSRDAKPNMMPVSDGGKLCALTSLHICSHSNTRL